MTDGVKASVGKREKRRKRKKNGRERTERAGNWKIEGEGQEEKKRETWRIKVKRGQ